MLHLWDGKHITILYNFYISIEWIKTIFVFVFIASKLNETLFNRVTTYLFRQNIVAVGCACYIYNTCALSKHIGNMCMTGADPIEKNMIFGVKSWFFTRNTQTNFAPPSAIGKNIFFWSKIVIFYTKYPENFPASLRSAQFFKSAPLTWNPGSAPVWGLETGEMATLRRAFSLVSRRIHIFTNMLRQCTCIVFILQF